MSFVESIAAGRAIVHPGEREPDADRELVALGAANLAGGVFRSLPAGGGLSQTAVNDTAQSKAAGALTAAVTLLTLLFLTSVFADLSQATLGALVLVSAIGLVQLEPLREIGRIHRSMLALVHALNRPRIERLEDGASKIHGPVYFADVNLVKRRVLELDPDPVIDMSAVHGIDVTAALAGRTRRPGTCTA